MKASSFINLLFTGVSLLLLAACARTTMVSGRITNANTGNPVAGMNVSIWAYNGNEPHDSTNPKKVGEAETITNANGEYALEYSGSGIDDVTLQLNGGWPCQSHYSEIRTGNIRVNHSTSYDVQIDSIDGQLDIVFNNVSGVNDSLFAAVDCDVFGEKGFWCSNSKLNKAIAPGTSQTLTFRVSAGREVPVYWSQFAFKNWDAPHIDKIFCPRNTTTTMTINL